MQEQASKGQGQGNADILRRKRIVFRAWHRGIREMDLLLGAYVDKHIEILNEEELQALEHIMSYEDNDLLRFFTGEVVIPANIDHKLFHTIMACRGRERNEYKKVRVNTITRFY